jgi:hypothetical protein
MPRGTNTQAVGAANRAKVAAALAAGHPPHPPTLAAIVGITRQNARKHLDALGVVTPHAAVKRARRAAPPPEPQPPPRPRDPIRERLAVATALHNAYWPGPIPDDVWHHHLPRGARP